MVRDAYYYALPLLGAAALVGWLAAPLWAVPAVLLAFFFFWFFRDPERTVPDAPNLLVSPADGKVTSICRSTFEGIPYLHISIFLSVFDVHVNRSPVSGVIRGVSYRKGKFLNAMNPASAEQNEQNLVTVEGEGHTVVFKQIAGLLARRIVFTRNVGDHVERGERIGLIKFGSRVDVLMATSAGIRVEVGDRVKGGSSVLAHLTAKSHLATAGAEGARQGAR
ncbi:MAG: phosphatidylserine decarboxylase [Terriglobales bacterium]|jgi:phosphatidylserine decarboxylase